MRAIFWKPEFEWWIEEIHVLKPIKYQSFMRNELNSKASFRAASRWARQGGGYLVEEHRAQRHSYILKDVAYVVVANVHLYESAAREGETAEEYRDQFRRRLQIGQCYSTPYLGCKEFSAFFSATDDTEQSIALTKDLGRMLFDLDYREDGERAEPRFFKPGLVDGVIAIPQQLYQSMNWRRHRATSASS